MALVKRLLVIVEPGVRVQFANGSPDTIAVPTMQVAKRIRHAALHVLKYDIVVIQEAPWT